MAIGELLGQLKMLEAHGEPDVQLSDRARDEYTRLIGTYRSVLVEQRAQVAWLANLGGAGNYHSAQETKRRLEMNATGLDGIKESLDNYIEYLNVFEDTVNAAFKRMQAEA